jgi:release factor glutamine methyltransferase
MTLRELQSLFLPPLAPEDFFVILSHLTGKEKVFLLAHPEYPLSAETEEKARLYLNRRLKHEPVAYLTGHREFYGRDYQVTRDTLIPRPETELMVERVLDQIKNTNESTDVIDIGTGSGIIIITLAKEREKMLSATPITYHALDISPRALTIAENNARTHDVVKKISFVESNLLQKFLIPPEKNRHAVIVANLPYLSHRIYNESDNDVRDYEPKSALESGEDGLDHYRRLLPQILTLRPHYRSLTFFFEISPEQDETLKADIEEHFPAATLRILPDYSGRARLIQGEI